MTDCQKMQQKEEQEEEEVNHIREIQKRKKEKEREREPERAIGSIIRKEIMKKERKRDSSWAG